MKTTAPIGREARFVLEDDRGLKSVFYQTMTPREIECVRTFDRQEALSSRKRAFSTFSIIQGLSAILALERGGVSGSRSASPVTMSWSWEEERELDGHFSWNGQLEKLNKIISARRILKELDQHYERIFKEQVSELGRDMSEAQVFFNSNLLYFIAATDSNEDTLGHSQYVASYALILARALGIDDRKFLCDLERGALLHDIGKIGVPDSILRKAGPLTAIEREMVKDHPLLGHEMISEFDFLRDASRVVLYHHESFDGSGYPYGLEGERIPLEARIFALADTLDAITSDRPYRRGKEFEAAIWEIEKCGGSQFDPLVVDVFLTIPKERWQRAKLETRNSLRLPSIH